jgi:SSS family solute:Na+ symporter
VEAVTSSTPALSALDAAVVASYLAAVVAMSFLFARRQRSGDDYFLAGRSMGGEVLACSIMANQASAVSLVGAPAFVALRPGGGLVWLQYELALPLAMLLLLVLLLPALRSVPGSSIYALAEARFGRATRRALAGAFLLSRGLALGVILYASALVVAAVLGWSVDSSLLLVGAFAVFYTTLGGIVADIWSDVLQLVLLWGGTLAAAAMVLAEHGTALLRAVPPQRLVTVAPGDPAATFSLWPMLLGGIFLYVSYYGCDQSQAQRLLTARDDRAAGRALVLSGVLRFPLVLTYCLFGLLLAGLLGTDPRLAAAMEGRPADSLVPVFMTSFLPSGMRGLMLAALLAAAMSSIDSALNSLAAVTLEDVAGRPAERQGVWLARGTTLAWGVFAVVSGMAFARAGTGVIELVNMIGSAFYGPVLAVFVLAVLAPGVGGRGALAGLGAGLAANLLVARLAPGISWMWWNPIGFATAAAAALIVSGAHVAAVRMASPRAEARLLLAAFVAMLATLLALPRAIEWAQ